MSCTLCPADVHPDRCYEVQLAVKTFDSTSPTGSRRGHVAAVLPLLADGTIYEGDAGDESDDLRAARARWFGFGVLGERQFRGGRARLRGYLVRRLARWDRPAGGAKALAEVRLAAFLSAATFAEVCRPDRRLLARADSPDPAGGPCCPRRLHRRVPAVAVATIWDEAPRLPQLPWEARGG